MQKVQSIPPEQNDYLPDSRQTNHLVAVTNNGNSNPATIEELDETIPTIMLQVEKHV